jgi:hypothetical protein
MVKMRPREVGAFWFWAVVHIGESVLKKKFVSQAILSGTKRYEAVRVCFAAGSTGQKATVKPSKWFDSL